MTSPQAELLWSSAISLADTFDLPFLPLDRAVPNHTGPDRTAVRRGGFNLSVDFLTQVKTTPTLKAELRSSKALVRQLPRPLRLAVFADSRAGWVVASLSV